MIDEQWDCLEFFSIIPLRRTKHDYLTSQLDWMIIWRQNVTCVKPKVTEQLIRNYKHALIEHETRENW